MCRVDVGWIHNVHIFVAFTVRGIRDQIVHPKGGIQAHVESIALRAVGDSSARFLTDGISKRRRNGSSSSIQRCAHLHQTIAPKTSTMIVNFRIATDRSMGASQFNQLQLTAVELSSGANQSNAFIGSGMLARD